MKSLDIPARAILPIPRVFRPESDAFDQEYAARGLPVVVQGVVDQWPAWNAWPAERINAVSGERSVKITQYEGNSKNHTRAVQMRVRDFIESVIERRPGSDILAWNGELVADTLPELAAEIRLPYLVRTRSSDTVAFVAGPREWPYRHVCNQFHYHPGLHAFAAQVQGRKLFRLYGPAESAALYPPRAWEKIPFRSAIEVHQQDLSRFPRLADAVCYETILEPGEMLFIPAGWWHLVANEEFAVLVTTFYPAPMVHWAFPHIPGFATLIDRIRRPRVWIDRLKPGHRGLASLAAASQ
jgi:hypothetical protein